MRERERRFSKGESRDLRETGARSLQFRGVNQEGIAAEHYDLSGGSEQSAMALDAFMKLEGVR
jgi:hypothetical protein